MTNRDNCEARDQDRRASDPLADWAAFLSLHRAELTSMLPEDVEARGMRVVAEAWLAVDFDGNVAGTGATAWAAKWAAIGEVVRHLGSPESALAEFGEDPPAMLSDLLPRCTMLRIEGPADEVASLVKRLERLA